MAHMNTARTRLRQRGSAVKFLVAAVFALTFAGDAEALSFRADFRESTFDVSSGATFAGLLAQHESETLIQSTSTTGLEGISTSLYAGGRNRDYSVLLTTTFRVSVAGNYTLQVGTDWGRGGAAALLDEGGAVRQERVIEDDVWWAYNWNHPDVFTTSADLVSGEQVTFAWVGFEGCCGGSSTIRFSYEGSPYQTLTETNFSPYVTPEPGSTLLIGLGLGSVALRRVRSRRQRA